MANMRLLDSYLHPRTPASVAATALLSCLASGLLGCGNASPMEPTEPTLDLRAAAALAEDPLVGRLSASLADHDAARPIVEAFGRLVARPRADAASARRALDAVERELERYRTSAFSAPADRVALGALDVVLLRTRRLIDAAVAAAAASRAHRAESDEMR